MKIFSWRGRMSKDAFRKRVSAEIRKVDATLGCTERGELDLVITGLPQHRQQTLLLDRAYAEFCKDPAQLDNILRRWLAVLDRSEHPTPINVAAIVPLLKSRAWVDAQKAARSSLEASQALCAEKYDAELYVTYAEFGAGVSYLSRQDVEATGIAKFDLRERALENFRRLAKTATFTGDAELRLIGVGGNLESALFLDDAFWSDPRLPAPRDLVAAFPERDSVIVGTGSQPKSVFAVAQAAAKLCRGEPYPITPQLYVRAEHGFRLLDPEIIDELHPIPRLDVIDVNVETDQASRLGIVIASPLGEDARSIFRLFRKIDAYIQAVRNPDWRQDRPGKSSDRVLFYLAVHPDSAPAALALIDALPEWCAGQGIELTVQRTDAKPS
jgi:uncharacterized protein YtpQ (UPF0354 family)